MAQIFQATGSSRFDAMICIISRALVVKRRPPLKQPAILLERQRNHVENHELGQSVTPVRSWYKETQGHLQSICNVHYPSEVRWNIHFLLSYTWNNWTCQHRSRVWHGRHWLYMVSESCHRNNCACNMLGVRVIWFMVSLQRSPWGVQSLILFSRPAWRIDHVIP